MSDHNGGDISTSEKNIEPKKAQSNLQLYLVVLFFIGMLTAIVSFAIYNNSKY